MPPRQPRGMAAAAPLSLLLAAGALAGARAQVPISPVTYQMNKSTIIMPCNYTGPTDPASTAGWAIVDFDWSNWKGRDDSEGWSKHKPMDCEELLVKQVEMTTAASPDTTVWVYRNSAYEKEKGEVGERVFARPALACIERTLTVERGTAGH